MDSAFYLSAAHKSSGKTVVGVGLCAALRQKGFEVQAFKKGPDYIDPLWLSLASDRPCFNLDYNTQTQAQILNSFRSQDGFLRKPNAVKLIEGNKGLHDGFSMDGSDANSALSKLLNVPVVLVLDVKGLGRGIAPLVQGYQNFDPDINIAGIILNKVGNTRHQSLIEKSIETYTDLEVFGAIPRDSRMHVRERQLGLTPCNELGKSEKLIAGFRDVVCENVNLDNLLAASGDVERAQNLSSSIRIADLKIAVARDEVFGFYYADDLQAFSEAGAEVVYFDSLRDKELPANIDGLFLGGGFPEELAISLEQNISMRNSVKSYIENNGPTYAECGGLIYLGRSITYRDCISEMVGALPATFLMKDRPVGRGLVRLQQTGASPWGIFEGVSEINAHEFHHSQMQLIGEVDGFAYKIARGWGIDGVNDGLIYKNTLASYCHLRSVSPINWVEKFVNFVRTKKNNA